jgi:hypothetical protein
METGQDLACPSSQNPENGDGAPSPRIQRRDVSWGYAVKAALMLRSSSQERGALGGTCMDRFVIWFLPDAEQNSI